MIDQNELGELAVAKHPKAADAYETPIIQFAVGEMYRTDKGGHQDHAEAEVWYRKARPSNGTVGLTFSWGRCTV